MKGMFVPYVGRRPKPVVVNGHRLIILSESREALEDGLELIGADRVKKMKLGRSEDDEEQALSKLAESIRGGVVVASADTEVAEVIKNLEEQLPWVQ